MLLSFEQEKIPVLVLYGWDYSILQHGRLDCWLESSCYLVADQWLDLPYRYAMIT